MRIGKYVSLPLVLAGVLWVVQSCREPVSTHSVTGPTLGPSADVIAPALATALATASALDTLFVIVQYDQAATAGATLAGQIMELGAGARTLKQLPFVGSLATPAQIIGIAALPGVVRVSANNKLRWLSTSASPLLALVDDESVPTIKADQAHTRYGVTGQGIGVTILDSGIDGFYQFDVQYPSRTVQNLKVIANQRDIVCFKNLPCAGSIYVENLPNSETSIGHGTHVAGIAGGNGRMSNGLYPGVAPAANLIGIGTGDVLFIFWALAGFDYVLTHQDVYNIKVVNNSWGTAGAFDPSDPINVATKRVHDRGITVVFAAGNGGPDQNTLNPYSVAPWVIGVAAGCSVTDATGRADHCGGGMLADFSSRGVPGDPLLHPTVTAPGVYVISARASTGLVMTGLDANLDASRCGLQLDYAPYYTCASGTSMAAPHVTGVVALMQERAGGTLTPDEVKDILVATADPMPGYQTFEVGAGLLDALGAVRQSLIGDLVVSTSTTGSDLDPDGYTVTVDGTQSKMIATNGSVTFTRLPAEDHSVALSGVAADCTVSDANPRAVTVPGHGTASTTFPVSCSATAGSLTVTTSTTGSNLDPDGYTVTLDRGQSQAVATNGSVTFTGLAAGDHGVALAGIATNCAVSGANPQTVTVSSGSTTSTTFMVSCATAVVRITGLGQIGSGSPSPGSDVQTFDFDVRADLTARFVYYDYGEVNPDGSVVTGRVDPTDPETGITAFTPSSTACTDPSRGAEFDGTVRLNYGPPPGYLLGFHVVACDNGPAASGVDFFRVTASNGYTRGGLLTSGDISKYGP